MLTSVEFQDLFSNSEITINLFLNLPIVLIQFFSGVLNCREINQTMIRYCQSDPAFANVTIHWTSIKSIQLTAFLPARRRSWCWWSRSWPWRWARPPARSSRARSCTAAAKAASRCTEPRQEWPGRDLRGETADV